MSLTVVSDAAGQPDRRPREPSIAVIVPVTRGSFPLNRLYEEFSAPLRAADRTFEFVFVAPEYARRAMEPLRELRARGEPIRILESGLALSESAMLRAAARHSAAPAFLTLPESPRVLPSGLIELLVELEHGYDLVTAARDNRSDALVNRAQRRAFHGLLRRTAGGDFTDVASGVRAMKREVLEDLDLYGDSFRFIPNLAMRDGFRVRELTVPQHPEDRKTRVYTPGIYVRRLIDLLGLMFLVRFTYKPLRFFGLIGSVLGASGSVILTILLVQRAAGQGIANRPLLLLGVLLVVLGMQAFAMGLIGEIVVHQNASKRPLYRVLEESSDTGPEAGSATRPPAVH
jgi:hypothetical protein